MKEMSAGLIIKDGRLLLVYNIKHGLRIEPPGGKKEAREGWRRSVARELDEELGINVDPYRLFGEYATHSPEGDFLVRMYLCRIIDGEPRVLEPEKISGFGWYTYDEMEKFRKEGLLVPNMASAFERLKKLL